MISTGCMQCMCLLFTSVSRRVHSRVMTYAVDSLRCQTRVHMVGRVQGGCTSGSAGGIGESIQSSIDEHAAAHAHYNLAAVGDSIPNLS